MIGSLDIEILEELPRIGDRFDYLVQISGPGENVYKKPASITRTLVSVWDLNKDTSRKDAIVSLVRAIIKVIGTASEPPGEGFWFDTYNAEESLDQTIKQVPNKPQSFIKGLTVRDEMVHYIGNEIMELLDNVEGKFQEKTNERFFNSLDRAFERSLATEDMNEPPNDRANYLYKICILSVILDRLNFNQYDNQGRSLVGFSSWIDQEYGEEISLDITSPLFMLKRLRRQYPLHEHYEENNGNLTVRQDLVEAENYFDIQNSNFSSDWNKVSQKFKESLEKFLAKLSQ